jgi:Holliday junction resolvase RusA-like endonuclease
MAKLMTLAQFRASARKAKPRAPKSEEPETPSPIRIPAGMGRCEPWLILEVERPPRGLSPNVHTHYIQKNKLKQEYGSHLEMAAYAACHVLKSRQASYMETFPWEFAVVSWQWRYDHKNKYPDGDNAVASLKAGFDGLTKAGVWRDDKYVLVLPPEFLYDKANPGLTLHIWKPDPSSCPMCGKTYHVVVGGPN